LTASKQLQVALTAYAKITYLSPLRRCSSDMVKMACERDEDAFMAVEPTVRAEFPNSRQLTIS